MVYVADEMLTDEEFDIIQKRVSEPAPPLTLETVHRFFYGARKELKQAREERYGVRRP